MVTTPVRVPVAVGLKLTGIAQLAPAATEVPHVPPLPKAKSPLMTGLPLNVRAALPVLVTVTDFEVLVVPTG